MRLNISSALPSPVRLFQNTSTRAPRSFVWTLLICIAKSVATQLFFTTITRSVMHNRLPHAPCAPLGHLLFIYILYNVPVLPSFYARYSRQLSQQRQIRRAHARARTFKDRAAPRNRGAARICALAWRPFRKRGVRGGAQFAGSDRRSDSRDRRANQPRPHHRTHQGQCGIARLKRNDSKTRGERGARV